MPELLGVSALATKIGVAKGTISKQAAQGKIPIARRDAKGNPLFDPEDVEKARSGNLNPLMRRTASPDENAAAEPPVDAADDAPPERRSAGPRPPSALVEQQKLEKQLKNRRLLRQIAEDEGLIVLKSVVDADQLTMARRTRDGVTSQMAEKASALYAFVFERPRTEAEFRVWLGEQTGAAFDETARSIAQEDEDEFGDGEPGDEPLAPGEPDAGAAS